MCIIWFQPIPSGDAPSGIPIHHFLSSLRECRYDLLILSVHKEQFWNTVAQNFPSRVTRSSWDDILLFFFERGSPPPTSRRIRCKTFLVIVQRCCRLRAPRRLRQAAQVTDHVDRQKGANNVASLRGNPRLILKHSVRHL